MLWSTQLKAALRSSIPRRVSLPWSAAISASEVTFRRAVSVEWLRRYADWYSGYYSGLWTQRFPVQVPSGCQYSMRLDRLHRAYPSLHPFGVVHWVPVLSNIKTATGCESNRQLQLWTVFAGTVVYDYQYSRYSRMGWAAMSNKLPGCHLANAWRSRSKHILQWRYRNEVSVHSFIHSFKSNQIRNQLSSECANRVYSLFFQLYKIMSIVTTMITLDL